ncbi:MAG: 3-dehydroquinate synthase [Planctomycetes bacterium]|nr:3-dehydroquinate synthase [Planctomycetota bacterium]
MREIELKVGRGVCRIFVEPGLLQRLHEILPAVLRVSDIRRPAGLVIDGNLRKWARPLEKVLRRVGLDPVTVIVPSGEPSKAMTRAETICRTFARARLERGSPIFGFGGGVVGDLAGFVASIYMRGVPFYPIPTTLLAQVDASIGGKTALNLPEGKNLVGTFQQPAAVFIDPLLLFSLPKREFVSGLAEVVKYGVIRDEDLFAFIEKNVQDVLKRGPRVLEEIVARCVRIKVDIVRRDERDRGRRAILNYGHTIGHAIERAGQYRRYLHGEAVSIGMEAEAVIAMQMRLASLEVVAAQNRLLRACGLPTRMERASRDAVLRAISHDKKVLDGRARFVLPERIGRVCTGVEVPEEVLLEALDTVTR